MTFRAKSELSWARQLLTRVVQFYFQPEQLVFQNLLVFVRRVSVDILCLKFSTFFVGWCVILLKTLLFQTLEFVLIIFLSTVGHLKVD